jgi:hypothetical protein
MNHGIQDTSPEIERFLIEGYRRMSLKQKLIQVFELTTVAQQFALARIRKEYGNISEGEQKLRLTALWLDRKTMIRIFNWDPLEKGY